MNTLALRMVADETAAQSLKALLPSLKGSDATQMLDACGTESAVVSEPFRSRCVEAVDVAGPLVQYTAAALEGHRKQDLEEISLMHSSDEVYQRLIAPIEAKMISIVNRIVGPTDEACDVFQEALAVVWQRLSKIDRHPNPQAYILRICLSQAYESLRQRRRKRRHEPLSNCQCLDQVPAPALEAAPRVVPSIDFLYDAIQSLPPQQGKALLLRIMQNESYETIGNILECSEAAARSHVSKGRERLRTMMSATSWRNSHGQ